MEVPLIELVKQCPVLYDRRNKNYKSIKLKRKKWRDIAAKLNVKVCKAKSRWKSLRDSYIREKKNFRNVKWRFFDMMTFLDNGPSIEIDLNYGSERYSPKTIKNDVPTDSILHETSFHLTEINEFKMEEPTELHQDILINSDESERKPFNELTPTMSFFKSLAILVESENLSFLRFSTLQTRVLSIVHEEIWKHREELQQI